MSDEYERGYRNGYRDGYQDGTNTKQSKWPRCTKCGISFEGFMGYVCTQSHCPMMPVTYSTADREWQRDHERSKY